MPDRGDDAGRDADEQGEQERRHREFDGRRHGFREQLGDRQVGDVGAPRSAMQDVTEPDQVLLGPGVVQAHLLVDGGDHVRRRVRSGEDERRIAGYEPEEDEDDNRRQHEDRERLGDAPDQVCAHHILRDVSILGPAGLRRPASTWATPDALPAHAGEERNVAMQGHR